MVSDRIPEMLERHYRSDVHDTWLDVRAYPTVEGLAVPPRDSTYREWVEEARRDAELFRTKGDTGPEFIFVKGYESRMTYAHPSLARPRLRHRTSRSGGARRGWTPRPGSLMQAASAVLAHVASTGKPLLALSRRCLERGFGAVGQSWEEATGWTDAKWASNSTEYAFEARRMALSAARDLLTCGNEARILFEEGVVCTTDAPRPLEWAKLWKAGT